MTKIQRREIQPEIEAERNRARISLRDQFAIAALNEILRAFNEHINEKDFAYPPDWRYGIAQEAYIFADAMIQARGFQ